MPISGKFPNGMKLTQVPLSWYRKVTAFLNNLCGGNGIDVAHPANPSEVAPVLVSIDEEWLSDRIDERLPEVPEAEDDSANGNPVAPSLTSTDDSPDFTSGGDRIADGDTVDTTTYPEAENDILRWMSNSAANALGSYEEGQATGAWTDSTTLETPDPLNPQAQAAVEWRHHVPLTVLLFSRNKTAVDENLFFARPARIDTSGRLSYFGAEICIARTLKGAVADANPRSIAVTSSGGKVGVVDANNTNYTSFAAAVSGIVAAASAPFPDQASAISGVVWRAGHGKGYEEATVSRIVPFWYNSSYGYVKIFTRVKRFSPAGLLYEVADEVDTGLVIQNYVTRP